MMAATVTTWTLCFALFVGVSSFVINAKGPATGDGSQSAVGDASARFDQQRPAVFYDSFANAKDLGSAGSAIEMDSSRGYAAQGPAGYLQQGEVAAAELGSSGFGGFGPSSGTIGASLPLHSSLSFRPETENFKAGDLFNQQEDYSHGHLVSETVQQGDMPLHRGPMSASGYVSPPRPEFGYLPYPYDYRFLTGKYPVGTYTHTSVSHSAGGRHWEDKHYVRYDPRPERPTETSNEPQVLQNVQAPSQQNPVQYRGARIQQTAPYGSAGLGQQVVYRQERRQAEGKV